MINARALNFPYVRRKMACWRSINQHTDSRHLLVYSIAVAAANSRLMEHQDKWYPRCLGYRESANCRSPTR